MANLKTVDVSRAARLRDSWRLVLSLWLTALSFGCGGVDQEKFGAIYRSGRAIEVDLAHSSEVVLAHSEKLLRELEGEIKLLEGRTTGEAEGRALSAYQDAAVAYDAFLDIRSLDLRGNSTANGRMLLGDGWVKGLKQNQIAFDRQPGGEWVWIDPGEAVTRFVATANQKLTEASRLVNGEF